MRSTLRLVCLTAAAAIWAGPRPAIAQEPPPTDAARPSLAQVAAEQNQAPPAGYVSALEGSGRVDRDGEQIDAERGLPIAAGDRVRTEAGRLEITLTDGSRLHLDRFSEIELPTDLVVRLARGRLLVTLRPGVRDRVSVEAPGALARFDDDGQYRVAVGGDDLVDVELAVLRGSAELSSDAGAVRLGTGERAHVRDGDAPSRPDMLAANPTTLERWADELASTNYQGGQVSQNYLPAELDTYAPSFDQYGTWQSDATYGYVWYPTVTTEWRPYYNGRWDHMRGYGWTWVAGDPWWGYPTHHYGRWQLNVAGAWFWVPSRHWGPAWVYWATTPTYVGWCPLGWNGRPVVNVFAYGGTVHTYRRGNDPWRAWTVLSADRFGRTHVPTTRIDRTTLDRAQPTFVMQHVQPGYAPPRSPYARTTQRADGTGTAPVRRPGGWVAPGPRVNTNADADASSRAPYAAAPRRGPSRGDDANGNNNGWSNYREYERQQRSGDNDGNRGSTGSTGWSNYREYERRQREQNQRDTDGSNDDTRGRTRSGGYVAPPTGYATPRSGGDRSGDRGGPDRSGGDRGGDRGGSRGGYVAPPRAGSGGNEGRAGSGGGGGGVSRSGGGDSGGAAAPRRRP